MDFFVPTFLTGKDPRASAQAEHDAIDLDMKNASNYLSTEGDEIIALLVLLETAPELPCHFDKDLPESTLKRVGIFQRTALSELKRILEAINDTRRKMKSISAGWVMNEIEDNFTDLHSSLLEQVKVINAHVQRLYYSYESPQMCVEAAKSLKIEADAVLVDQIVLVVRADALPTETITQVLRQSMVRCMESLRMLKPQLQGILLDVAIVTQHPVQAALRPQLKEVTYLRFQHVSMAAYPSLCAELLNAVVKARTDPDFTDEEWLQSFCQEVNTQIHSIRAHIDRVRSAVFAMMGDDGGLQVSLPTPENDEVRERVTCAQYDLMMALEIEQTIAEVHGLFTDMALLRDVNRARLRNINRRLTFISKLITCACKAYEDAIDFLLLPAAKAGILTGGAILTVEVGVHLAFAKCLVGAAFAGHVAVFAVPAVVVYAAGTYYNFDLSGRFNLWD